jgi:hypothetical protein
MNDFFYNSLDEKKRFFTIYNINGKDLIDDKSQFDQLCNDLHNASNVYRGVHEAKYHLFTSIQRAFIEGSINSSETVSSFIAKEIDQLKRDKILPKYWNSLGIPITDFLYLSFLQHYASPTSLLDFTHNEDVALYFATESTKYVANVSGKPKIDDYFSIYWIDRKESESELINVVDFYMDGYIKGMEMLLDTRGKKPDLSIDDSNLTDLGKYLSWKNENDGGQGLSTLGLGFIDCDNAIRHELIGDIKVASNNIKSLVATYYKKPNNTALQKVNSYIIKFFKEIIKVVNLNLVAQEGCFIHYIPNEPYMPLEEFIAGKAYIPKIHCANIHKSLSPYIKNKLLKNKITKETIYPDPHQIVNRAYIKTLIDL